MTLPPQYPRSESHPPPRFDAAHDRLRGTPGETDGHLGVTRRRAFLAAMRGFPRGLRGGALVLVAVIAFPGWSQAQPAGRGTPRASVAVLPFTNLSRDPADDWIGEGIAETVLTGLIEIGFRTTTLAAREDDPARPDGPVALESCRRLGVATCVRGTYQRVGHRLRITAEVVDPASGRVVHHASADAVLRDLFAAQDQIFAAVAERFKPPRAPAPARVDRRRSGSPSTDPLARPPSSPLSATVPGAIPLSMAPQALPTFAGVQTGSSFYFRGLVQETQGFIAQPYLETSVALFEGDGPVNGVGVTAGTWSSLHSGPSGSAGAPGDPQMWYETDFYASVGVGFAGAWSTDVTYTAYMSPNQSFETIKELALGVSYDDGLLGPYASLAVELEGQGDGGLKKGTYLELGVEPGLGLSGSTLGLSFPVAVGFSVHDYYEGLVGDGTFGFLNLGAIASVPIGAIPAQFGSWEVSGGVNVLVFGDAVKSINGATSTVKPIGVLGLTLGP